MIGRWVPLVLLLVPLFSSAVACGQDDTFERFDGEYQFLFPSERDKSALEAVAKKCGVGHGVEDSHASTNSGDGSPVVVVNFKGASPDDQKRVALCAEDEGSTGQLVP